MVRDWWTARRNAILSSPRFQTLALRLPITRPVARAHARHLFDLVAGFTYSQTLAACVELDLFERLRAGPLTLEALAAATDLPGDSMARLVGAAEPIGLLERLGDGRVALGVAGAALLGNPGAVAMVAHHRLLYADLADPVAQLRRRGGGELARFWDYVGDRQPDAYAAYSALMAASLPPVAAELLDAWPIARHRRLLDVGGGEGRFLAEARRRAPGLSFGLFDLPGPIGRARDRLGDGVEYHPGDFTRDALPTGYDCITLVRVLHDHDDAVAAALLGAIHAALSPGGVLVIAEPMIGARNAETVGATYFAFYLLAMGQGRARSPGDIGRMLHAAGFGDWRERKTRLPLNASVIVARKK